MTEPQHGNGDHERERQPETGDRETGRGNESSPGMNDRQREMLLDRIHRSSGALGHSIPETLELEDETVPLREFYFEVSNREPLDEADRESVQEILTYLRRERAALVTRIRTGEVDYETGEALVPTIRDLDRAINAFESLEDPEFEEQVRRERVESARELVDFMREFGKL